MTTLGKILVFVNLVFSLVTGALIVMVFSTRTNWYSGFKKAEDAVKVSTADARALVEEVKLAKSRGDAKAKELQGELAKLAAEREKLQKDLLEKDAQLKTEMANVKDVRSSIEGYTGELTQRQNEVKQHQATIADLQQKQLALETRYKEVLDRSIRADIAARTILDRLKRTQENLEALTKENERLQHGTAVAEESRPPEDVKGLVLSVDHKSQLLTISLGSDAGLSEGHTLEVYRLGPEPKYLGKVRLVKANHHEAVAQPLNLRLARLIQKGDSVASNIYGQR
jgi:cell shape-determining protein MreC